MANAKHTYQVVIVGGGPSGIAAAMTLLAKGIDCCVVEAQKKPVKKAGEAIPPNAKPLLQKLGMLDLVADKKHAIYYGNKTCWGTDLLERKEFISNRLGHGILLDRLHFETQLQTLYEKQHAKFYKGYKLKKVVSEVNGITAIIENSEEILTLQGRFIIDATGRKASVCRHLGVQKTFLDTQFALTCTVSLHEKIPKEIMVEATENGWWYMAPYSKKEVTLMFFTLKALLPAKEQMQSFLQSELQQTKHLHLYISNISTTKFSIIPAGTSCLQVPFGNQWLAVGDAAYSFDPISSYGITSALASGYYGGHAVADFLQQKPHALETYRYVVENAFRAYLEKLVAHYQLEKRWQHSGYWQQRLAFLIPETVS